MPNWLSRRVLIVALLSSLAAAAAAYYYLSTAVARTPVDAGPQAEVVVALQDIPADTRITREMVTTRKVPAQYAHPTAAGAVEEVIGSIARVAIVRDEQLLSARLGGEGRQKTRLAYAIPEGHRAVTISVNEVKGVGGYPTPGDRVDVLLIQDEPVVSKILLQNIKILATGPATAAQDGGEQLLVPSFTLSVTPEQAQVLTLAESLADSVWLSLRAPDDNTIVTVPPTRQL